MADGSSRSTDLYTVLGIRRTAGIDEIRRAYRRLARDLHPDVRPDDAEAEERFKQVSHAYNVLSTPERRRLYDEFGDLGLREGFDPRPFRAWQQRARQAGYQGRIEDLFRRGPDARIDGSLDDLLAGNVDELLEHLEADERAHQKRVERPAVRRVEVALSFLDALRGAERELRVPSRGREIATVRVRIPAGVRDGETVRVRSGPRSRRRDVVMTVRVEPHPVFWRQGDDLHLEVPVTPSEAYRGTHVSVPTPEGSVSVAVPAGTSSGKKLRLRGRGVRRGDGPPGDLYAHVSIVLPPAGDENVARVLDQVSARCSDVRAHLRL